MAVWQAKLYPILHPPVPGGWRNWPGLPNLRAALTLLFGPEESDGTALHWGPYDRHDARLWLDDEEEPMLVRLDLRDLDRAFVQALASLLSNAGLCLLVEDGTLIEAIEDGLLTLIRASNAARFMKNPRAYLDSLPEINTDPGPLP